MAEKSKKPRLRFKGFTETWEQCKLGNIGKARSGIGFPDEEQGGKVGVPFYKVSDMNCYGNEVEMIVSNNYVTQDQIARKRWHPIEQLPAMFFAKVGAAVMLNRKRLVRFPFLLDNNTMAYSLDNAVWNTDFAKAIFNKINLPSLVQVGALPSYNASDVEAMEILLPAMSEQSKIGTLFTYLDNLITLHQRKYDKFVAIKKALLEKMFPRDGKNVPEIRFKGFTETWEQRELGKIGTTFTGLSGKSKFDFGHGQGKFITYMNVFSNPISNLDAVEPIEIDIRQNSVLLGDVFFTTSSETPDEVGMSSVLTENSENTYLNSFCFGYRPSIKLDNYYLAYMLRSSSFRKKITFLAQGISRYNISKNKVMEIEIPIPTLEEQKKIGEYFRNIDNLITLHQRQLERLKNIKSALLEKMFV